MYHTFVPSSNGIFALLFSAQFQISFSFPPFSETSHHCSVGYQSLTLSLLSANLYKVVRWHIRCWRWRIRCWRLRIVYHITCLITSIAMVLSMIIWWYFFIWNYCWWFHFCIYIVELRINSIKNNWRVCSRFSLSKNFHLVLPWPISLCLSAVFLYSWRSFLTFVWPIP